MCSLSVRLFPDCRWAKRETSPVARLLAELCQHMEFWLYQSVFVCPGVCFSPGPWLPIRHSCCGRPQTASAHIDASCADVCTCTKTHVGVQAAAQRPRPPLAGPSAYALLITSPFIPNAMRPRFQSRRITELRWIATATEQASSLSSCAIIFLSSFQYRCKPYACSVYVQGRAFQRVFMRGKDEYVLLPAMPGLLLDLHGARHFNDDAADDKVNTIIFSRLQCSRNVLTSKGSDTVNFYQWMTRGIKKKKKKIIQTATLMNRVRILTVRLRNVLKFKGIILYHHLTCEHSIRPEPHVNTSFIESTFFIFLTENHSYIIFINLNNSTKREFT